MKLKDKPTLVSRKPSVEQLWQKINSFTDESLNVINIYHMEQLGYCPAMPLFLKVYAEIIEKGWANPFVAWTNKNRMIWAQNGDKILGGICYDYQHDLKMGWIILSFVDPEERGKGIYKKLHYEFENSVRELGGVRIGSYIHIDNQRRINSATKVGMSPLFYRMHKFI